MFRRLTFLGASSLLGGIALLLRYCILYSLIFGQTDAYSAVPCILVLYGPSIRARSAIAKVDKNHLTSFCLLLIGISDFSMKFAVKRDLRVYSCKSSQITLVYT